MRERSERTYKAEAKDMIWRGEERKREGMKIQRARKRRRGHSTPERPFMNTDQRGKSSPHCLVPVLAFPMGSLFGAMEQEDLHWAKNWSFSKQNSPGSSAELSVEKGDDADEQKSESFTAVLTSTPIAFGKDDSMGWWDGQSRVK